MTFAALPPRAAWRHCDAREGFEVVFLSSAPGGHRLEGHSAAVEDGQAWAVRYTISLAADWTTRDARVVGQSRAGRREVSLEADGRGAWRVDGVPADHLDGCLDVDLESSACTNALPVHRLGLAIDHAADAPAAYVRAVDLGVERLEQRYARVADEDRHQRYDYSARRFEFACQLVYDRSGLPLDYPGIAVRAG